MLYRNAIGAAVVVAVLSVAMPKALRYFKQTQN